MRSKIKSFIFLYACFFSPGKIFSQPGYTEKLFGLSGHETNFSFIQTRDKGYAMVGTTTSTGEGGEDVCFSKLDSNENLLWTKTYGGPLNESGNYIRQTTDGGYVIAGYARSYGAGDYDGYIIRTDSAGTIVWNKTYGGLLFDKLLAIEPTTDSNFIAIGSTSSFGAGGSDILIMKLNQNGDTLWTRIFGGPLYDAGISATQANDGSYTFSGRSGSFDGFFINALIFKTDSNGNLLWLRSYGGIDSDEGMSIKQTADSGYIITGSSGSFTTLGINDAYLVKTDTAGFIQWSKTYGGPKMDATYAVVQTEDGGYAITGFTDSYSYLHTRGDDSSDVILIKTNAIGDTLWSRVYGGNRTDEAYSVIHTSDGGYTLGAYSNSFSGSDSADIYIIHTDSLGVSDCHTVIIHPDITNPNTIQNTYFPTISSGLIVNNGLAVTGNSNWLFDDPCIPLSAPENTFIQNKLVIYPNPFNNFAEIILPGDLKQPAVFTLTLYDIFGKVLRRINNSVSSNGKIKIEKGNLAEGIYFIELNATGKEGSKGKIIITN